MAAKPNDPAQQRIVDFLKAGGAELLTDEELNCAMAVLEDDDEGEPVEIKEDDKSIAIILERIRKLKAMEEHSARSSPEQPRSLVSKSDGTKQEARWLKPLLALAASVLVAFVAGYLTGDHGGPTGTLVAQVSSEQVALRGGEEGLKITVSSPREGYATLVVTGSAQAQVLPNVDASDVSVADGAAGQFEIRREGYEHAYVFVTQVPAQEFIRSFLFGSPPPDAARLREAIAQHLRSKGFAWVAVSTVDVPATDN